MTRVDTFVILFVVVAATVDVIRIVPMVEASSIPGSALTDPVANRPNHAKSTHSDSARMEELWDVITQIQNNITEIIHSFATLNMISRHPSMLARVKDFERVNDRDGRPMSRRAKRDVDAPFPAPTDAPSSGQDQNSGKYFAPYSWPMFSGQCFLCPAGVPGPRGPPGPAGGPGRDGRDGRDAVLSPQAPLRGDTPAGTEDQNGQQPTSSPPSHDNTNTSRFGAVYVRWGNSECPDGAELIYAGTAGGAHYNQGGSGSNYLCLPEEPIYDEVDAANADRALLYSSEYQTSGAPESLRPVHDHAPTCALCRAPAGRMSTLMVPARNVCPSDDWRLEYGGYLMSARYTHKRSEFICVDRTMEAASGTQGNQDGALLYMVEGRCQVGGGLPCGPYIEGYELTCAVCTI